MSSSFETWCQDRAYRFEHTLNKTVGRILRNRAARTKKLVLSSMDYESRGNTLHAPGSYTPHDDLTTAQD